MEKFMVSIRANRLLMLGLLLVISSALVAQISVSGFVRETGTNDAIAYATVSLLRTDSTLITGSITDENGYYTMSTTKGDYLLQVSFVGYQTESRVLNIHSSSLHVDDIFLQETTAEIAEVEVRVKRPLVERQMDKIVLNVSNSTFSAGINGKEVLKKAPGVMIDKDGNVTVNGKSVEIYIDGRPSYMGGEQLRGLLEGTDASMIEKVEIMTNPSSKYDASGQGGIINIKLKKNKSQGLNGMVSAAYEGMYWRKNARYLQQDYVDFNLNYRSQKTYTALSLTQVYADQMVDYDSKTVQPTMVGQSMVMGDTSVFDLNFQYYNLRLSNDWYVDSKNTLGFIVNVPIMSTQISADQSKSVISIGDDIVQDIRGTNMQYTYAPQHTANINYTYMFADSLSRELTANIDYNRYNTQGDNLQTSVTHRNLLGSVIPDELDVQSHQCVDIYSAKVDFQTAFWKTGMLECGAKWVMSHTDNRMDRDSTIVGVVMPGINTKYDYQEQVGALYISAAKQFNTHWSAKLGLRGELTYSRGLFHERDVDSLVERQPYIDIFPTAFVGYTPTDKWNLNMSFTRRIRRPSYYQLNPFINYLDAHTMQSGNPTLSPEYNNQFDLNVAWSRYISLSINVSHTQSMLNYKYQILGNGDQIAQWVNFGTCTSHGATLSLTEVPIIPKYQHNEDGSYVTNDKGRRQISNEAWLTLTASISSFHFINKAEQDANYGSQASWMGNMYACLTAYLPKDCQISVDGNWHSPVTTGYTTWGGSYGMNLALKKQFLQRRLTLSVNIKDIMNSTYSNLQMFGLAEGYSSAINQRIYLHSVSVGLSYMFGQQQWGKWRKHVGDNEFNSRLGGGGGVGK